MKGTIIILDAFLVIFCVFTALIPPRGLDLIPWSATLIVILFELYRHIPEGETHG